MQRCGPAATRPSSIGACEFAWGPFGDASIQNRTCIRRRNRWPAENPYAANPQTAQRDDPRRPAGLPDPAVVYQLVLRRPGDVIQVLSEFRADQPQADQPHYAAYSVQNFPGRVGEVLWNSEISALLPWNSNPARPEDMYLETRLVPTGQAPHGTARRAIISRHSFNLPQPPRSLAIRATAQPGVIDYAESVDDG